MCCVKVPEIPRYYFASVLVAFGGMLFGMDTGTIGPVTIMPQFTDEFGKFSSTVHGLIVSAILIPAALSSFFAGHLADRIGRPRAIAAGELVFAVGSAVEGGAMDIAMLVVGRIMTGVGEGLFLSTLVVYICEISPAKSRGLLGSIPQVIITIGIVTGFFTSYGTSGIRSSLSWRLPFVLQSLLAVSFSISSLLLLPQSPRWLLLVGRKEESRRAWDSLGVPSAEREKEENATGGPAQAQMMHAPTSVLQQGFSASTRYRQRLKQGMSDKGLWSVFAKDVRGRTALASFLMAMQQLSGIDGVLYYAPLLFQQAGLSSTKAAFLASGVTSLVIFAVTIPAFLLADRWGRRTSTIWGGIGLAISMLLIGSMYAANTVHAAAGAARWAVVVAIYVFAAIFSVTWAVGIKVYASEIQPTKTRAAATSLSQSSNWIMNYLVALTTPMMLAKSRYAAYFLFGSASMVTTVVCTYYMPETKGKALEEIEEAFTIHRTHMPGVKQIKHTLHPSRW